jgi:hypothetical protein
MKFYDIGENFSDEVYETVDLLIETLHFNDISTSISFCALINLAVETIVKDTEKAEFMKLMSEIWDIHKENCNEEED